MSTALALSTLCKNLVTLIGEPITGTPSGTYTTTGFDCAGLGGYDNDYFNDWWGRFYEATNKDKTFLVTDFVTSTGHFTFTPAATLVDALDLFYLVPPPFKPEDLITAINMAISQMEDFALQDKVDATLETVASTYEYTIPSGFVYISDIYLESGTANRYSDSANRIDDRHWRILHGATPKLWFDNNYVSLTATRNLRLVGQQRQSQLTLDADTCAINQSAILYQAAANLHFSRIEELGDAHDKKMQVALAVAERESRKYTVAGRGRKVAY
jgi:hypothetical protein